MIIVKKKGQVLKAYDEKGNVKASYSLHSSKMWGVPAYFNAFQKWLDKNCPEVVRANGYTYSEYLRMDTPPYDTDTEGKIKWNEFVRALINRDFSTDDAVWLNGIEFVVRNKEVMLG
jgi:hypothetical protein